MALRISDEAFDELLALAQPLLDRAREITMEAGFVLPDTDEAAKALTEEVQGFSLAFMALLRSTGLEEGPAILASGAAIGAVLAQCTTDHAVAWKLCRDQIKGTYDNVLETVRPKGSC